LSRLGKIVPTS